MAIVQMSRFKLVAFQSERSQVLRRLQAMADVHLAPFEDFEETEAEGADAMQAAALPTAGQASEPQVQNLPKGAGMAARLDASLEAGEPQQAESPTQVGGYETATAAPWQQPVSDEDLDQVAFFTEKIRRLEAAIKTLEALKPPQGMLAGLNNALPVISYEEALAKLEETPVDDLCDELRQITDEMARIKERKTYLVARKAELRRFHRLDMPFSELVRLKEVRTCLGSLPLRWEEDLEAALAPLELVHVERLDEDEKNATLLLFYHKSVAEQVEAALREHAFSEEQLQLNTLPEEGIRRADEKLQELDTQLAERENALQTFSDLHLEELKIAAESLKNERVQAESRENLRRSSRLFFLEGYVPSEKEALLREQLSAALQQPYELQLEAVSRRDETADKVPVLLRNNALVSPFESIVNTYSLPHYNELDPTGVTMPWYSLCFGLMLGDLGYGLVMFILATLGLHLFKMKPSTRQTLRFFQILSVPTMLSGLAFGSFFALSFPSLISPGEQSMEMLVFSMAFGIVMLFFALGIKGVMEIRDGDPMGAVYDVLSWYLIVGGALVLLVGSQLGFLSPAGQNIVKWAMIVGALLVVLFSARDSAGLGGRIGWGLYNLYGATSWIGDLVSYTRIAALVMSGGFIGYAVNLIGGMLFEGSIPGKVGALLVFFIFHAFNIFLSGLSAYVHSLRLIYVEFYGKFYEGGGLPFKRYRADAQYYEVR